MRHTPLLLALPLALALAACGRDDAASDAAVLPDAQAAHAFSADITADDFDELVKTLASDEFGGRAPGTDGEEKTVEYIKAQYERIGLEPGGDNGTFFQTVPMVETTADESTVLRLDVAGQQRDLDGEHAEKQEVIAREQSVRRIEAPGADHQRHRDAAEQAGPGLLDAEAKEFVKPRGPAALRHHQAEAMFGGDEAAQRRPVGRGARDRFGLACYPVMHAADGGGRSRSQRGGVVQISLNP